MIKNTLSIITINYNNKEGLLKTMLSVFSQSYKDIEYIIIDGGSEDGSKELIENHSHKCSFSLSEADTGVFNAMNKGIKKANGEYLLFLNSGDVLSSETAILNFIKHPNFNGDIIYGDYKFEKGEKIYPDVLTPLFFIKTSLPHQSTFFRRSVFDVMGLYDETFKIAADRAFYIVCFLTNKFKFTHIKYPLTVYDQKGISNDKEYKTLKENEDESIFKKYYGLYYSDYKNYLELEQKISHLKRNSFNGYLKRVIKKVKDTLQL